MHEPEPHTQHNIMLTDTLDMCSLIESSVDAITFSLWVPGYSCGATSVSCAATRRCRIWSIVR